MKIKPLFDRILVKEIENKKNTNSGIILPTSTSEKPLTAKVVAVGDGGKIDGENIEIKIKENDMVIFNKYSASEFDFENEKYLILKQTDILAKLDK